MSIRVGWFTNTPYLDATPPPSFVASDFVNQTGSWSSLGYSRAAFYAGVLGYTVGVVDWTLDWVPTFPDGNKGRRSIPKTSGVPGSAFVIKVYFDSLNLGSEVPAGVLTLRASVNGVTLPSKLSLSITPQADFVYSDFAWVTAWGTPYIPPSDGGGGPPGLGPPSDIPGPRWVGHTHEMGSVYANLGMQTGHDRRRRVYTEVPRVVSVSWDLDLYQTTEFRNWYESDLNGGMGTFYLKVANQGPGVLWYRARFLEPYTAEANESGQAFWISAKVLLYGEGTPTVLYTPEIEAGAVVGLIGQARLHVFATLGADVLVGLLPRMSLYSNTLVALNGGASELREDGSFLLREDDSKILREP